MDAATAKRRISPRPAAWPRRSLAAWHARVRYARAHWLHRRVGDTQAALERYCELVNRFPDSPEARYARIHIRKIRCSAGAGAAVMPAFRLPESDNTAAGNRLRLHAVREGRFIAVRISNVYDTVQALASFLRDQQREWVAVCLLDEALVCHLIWVNGGGVDQVRIRFGVEAFVHGVSPFVGARNIIVAHNHPTPLPGSALRRLLVMPRKAHATIERLTVFSRQDVAGAEAWRTYCRSNGLGYAEVLVTDRNILISGEQELVDDLLAHRPPSGWRVLSTIASVLEVVERWS